MTVAKMTVEEARTAAHTLDGAIDALIAAVRAEERERWADYLDAHKDDLAMGAGVVRAGGWFDACVNGAAAIRAGGKP